MLKLVCLLLGLVLILFTVDAQTYLSASNCTKSENYTQDFSYQYSLDNLLGTFTSQASNKGFYNSSFTQNDDQVYGLYMCRGDVIGQECDKCVDAAKDTIIQSCPNQKEDIIWFDECMIRYAPNSFFGILAESPAFIMWNIENVTENQNRFVQSLMVMMSGLVDETTNSSLGTMYGTRVVNVSESNLTVYAMQQCTPDLNKSDCRLCLTSAIQMLVVSRQGSRVLSPSCVVRYEMYRFFGPSTVATNASSPTPIIAPENPSSAKGNRHSLLIPMSILVSIVSVGICSLIGIWICKKKKRMAEPYSGGEMDEIMTAASLQFDWNTIKGATYNFRDDRKLGEGGFGQVYKGILEDGQEIAVKRLSKNSGQGIVEFHTEIVVVAKLQHKNLVKLLGFCLAPMEKILVYEYLPNLSLDRFISDMDKRVSMVWETRFKIICGVARGLLYLHEDSRLKIIHRDLKPSNILLDEGMNPKIADFGLARLFEVDQTQGDTMRIVGTYGYMAPEYAMTGHFSVKSDVYSFGVIILEILSGQRNRLYGRSQSEEALLHRAWRLWNEGLPLSLIDTTLGVNYPKEEVIKCIQIGLLCIQDNATERPGMASVVAALNGQSISLPLPRAPTFFGDPITTSNEMANSKISAYHHQVQTIASDSPYIYTGTQGTTDFSPR